MAKGSPSLPPGFRFHPTDEELILHYLRKRAAALPWPVSLIADVDIYKFDPWDLPAKAKFGEREWYFFSPRDRKYPNGARPNRSAASGYWKATGTDKAIVASQLRENIGVKKTLVFYKGKPNNGVKTSWIMHEYRLNDQYLSCGHKPLVKQREDSMRLDDWVLCRIYQKNRGQALVDEEQGNSASEETEKQNSDCFSLSEMLTEEADYFSVSRMLETQMSSIVSDRPSFSNPELIHPLEQNIDGICIRYSEGPVFDGCYGG